MRILIVGINYHPELTGIGKYTGEMSLYLSGQGNEVRVITAPPYYPYWQVQPNYRYWQYKHETLQGVDVFRCPLWVPRKPSGITRMIHLLSFTISSLPVLLLQVRWKPDLVLCIAPAIFNAPFALLTARLSKAKTWLHIQDFELDAALQLGMLPFGDLLASWASRAEKNLLKKFERVSTISKRMIALLIEKSVSTEQVTLFPNWVDTDIIFPLSNNKNLLRESVEIPQDAVIILYAGNMGKKQGIEYIIEAAKNLQSFSSIRFILCGEGAVRDEMVYLSTGINNIQFLPLQPIEKLNELLNLADVHLLPQRSGAADLVMPSKLTGMLASGKVVIAMADDGTELFEVVNQVGVVIPPEDVQALQAAILQLAEDEVLRQDMGLQGRKFAEENWNRPQVLGDLQIAIRSLLGEKSKEWKLPDQKSTQ